MRTGEIMALEEMQKRIKQEPKTEHYYQEIPAKFWREIEGMNRHERRAWMSQNKRRVRKALKADKLNATRKGEG